MEKKSILYSVSNFDHRLWRDRIVCATSQENSRKIKYRPIINAILFLSISAYLAELIIKFMGV